MFWCKICLQKLRFVFVTLSILRVSFCRLDHREIHSSMEAATVGKNDPEQRNSFLEFNFISTKIHFGTIFGKCWTKDITQCMKVPFASSTWDCIGKLLSGGRTMS